MEKKDVEILLEEKLIKLLESCIALGTDENRSKTYSLLKEVSSERSESDTRELIDKIDNQIRSFGVDSIKKYFDDNIDKYDEFKDEIDAFIKSIENKVSSYKDKEKVEEMIDYVDDSVKSVVDEAQKNIDESEYNFFESGSLDKIGNSEEKLTRESINGFMQRIDDKLAELEAEASALDEK